jgi:hypothetical protein
MIAKKPLTCKSTSPKLLNPIDLGAGNIVPNWMYKKILTTGGKSDTMAIALLSELWFLYRSTGQEEHQKDYDYFCNKFNLSRYQVREAFIRLEALGLMKRSVGTIIVQGRKIANILFVTLNVKKLLEITPSYLRPESDDDGNNNNQNQESIFFRHRVGDSENKDSKISDGRIVKNNLKENRSTKSNFCKISALEEKPIQTTVLFPVTGFSLASFYPLSQHETAKLNQLCGREFSGNAINEILLSMSKRLTDRLFKSKEAFMNYMAKALTYELRDPVKTSNRAFRIKANISEDQIIKQQKAAFLNKIEESTDTTLAAQLSRKLASILSPDLAYNFLLSAKFPPRVEGNSFEISLQKRIDLSQRQYRLILEQVQSVYGSSVSSLEFIIKNQETPNLGVFPADFLVGNNESEIFPRVWGRIRRGLIKTCGKGIDRNWFSKLKVNVDEERGEIKLQAPNGFVRDWIQQNYQHLLERFCNKENYRLMEVGI